jgi:hypothetical protein
MLARSGASYRELGGSYFDERRKDAIAQRLVRRLETLGFAVSLKEVAA